MTTISTISNFTQDPPSTSDPDNFDTRADSAFSDLHDSIIPNMNTSIGQMNTVVDEVNNNKEATDSNVTTTEMYKNLAKDWATATEGTLVENLDYSALHYKEKAKEYSQAVITGVDSDNYTGSISFSIGVKNLTISSGKNFKQSMWLVIIDKSSPLNWMAGWVESYDSSTGDLSVNILNLQGDSSCSDWILNSCSPAVQTLPDQTNKEGYFLQSLSGVVTWSQISIPSPNSKAFFMSSF